MRKIAEIIELIRVKKVLKTAKEVAALLDMDDKALSAHKQRGTLPLKQLVDFCLSEDISLDWLILGEGSKHRSGVDKLSLDDKNHFTDDLKTHEIIEYIRENEDEKETIYQMISHKRSAREAAEKFLKGK